jgi:hypothetical protein
MVAVCQDRERPDRRLLDALALVGRLKCAGNPTWIFWINTTALKQRFCL